MSHAVRCIGLLGLLVLAGCAKDEDYLDVMREQRAAWKEMADILETVKDEKSMAEAQTKLKSNSERYAAIARKAKALPNPPPPEVAERMNQQTFVMQEAMKRLQKEVGRVSKEVPGGRDFLNQFESISPGLLTAVQQ
jgi:hypothetical protein